MKPQDWIIPIAAAGLAAAIYLSIGRPGMADRPMAERLEELAAKSPEDMTPAEWLTRLEVVARERPDDPQAQFLIGQLLMQQGRMEDAVRAYQAAIRRDPRHVPSMMALGDALVAISGGEVTGETARVFAAAYQLDPSQLRAVFLVGVSAWQSGAREQARAIWAEAQAALPEGSQAAAEFSAAVEDFQSRPGANSAAVPPGPQ